MRLSETALLLSLRLRRLRSSENWVVGVASRSGRTKPITKRFNEHCDWLILPLLLPTPTIWFSLDHKRKEATGVISGVARKWKRSDSSYSDSVELMAPLTTTIFEFHKVISALTIPIPTLSLVKASLYAWKQPYHSRSDIHGHLSLPQFFFFFTSSCLSSVRPQKVVIRCPVLYAKALISAPAPLNTFGSWLQLKFVFVFTHLGAVVLGTSRRSAGKQMTHSDTNIGTACAGQVVVD